jgi:DNA polymerase-3 subunit gamma/tau
MPSQALYRKWRSQTFQELIGQEAVVRTLKNALQSGRIAHAYLFCGPRGTGKTSTARLLAKTVNCQHPQNGEPCNECPNCREITENRSLDVIEIDAASNRGIPEMRDLIDKVGFRPGSSKYKVYVLDEAHMLTPDACNALLKTLEEPPPYVIFVLATTEAHRMLPTIVSRCQRFDFKRHSFRNMVAHLQYVAGQEGVMLENGAAELLARAAAGGMRDALNLLDQAMAAMGATVTQAGVQQMLGLTDPRSVRELVEHIAYLRGADGLHLINRLAEAGADLRQLSAQVADYWRALMLARAGADIVAVLDRTPEEAAEIRQLAELFALDELSACARLFSQNDTGARSITIPQLAVELAFIDCLHLHRQRTSAASSSLSDPADSAAPMPASSPAPTSATNLRQVASPTRPATAPVDVPAPSQAKSVAAPQSSPSGSAHRIRESSQSMRNGAPPLAYAPAQDVEIVDLDTSSLPLLPAEPAQLTPDQAQTATNSARASSDADEQFDASQFVEEEEAALSLSPPQAGLSLNTVMSQWEMVKKACRTKTPKLAALLNDAHPVAVTIADGCEVVIQVDYDFHYKKLLEPENRNIVEWALKEMVQVSCRCRFIQKGDPIPVSTPLPPASPAPSHRERKSSARQQPPAPFVSSPLAPAEPSAPQSGADSSAPIGHDVMPAKRQTNTRAAQNDDSAPATSSATSDPAQASAQPANLLEAKVRQDPVIGEIIKTYGATLVEWKPLGE